MKSNKGRNTFRGRLNSVLGNHKLALEHIVVSYALQGYNAATIRRRLKRDYPDLIKETINENAILWNLKNAIQSRVVTFHAPRLNELGAQLEKLYQTEFKYTISFSVADDSIGFRHALSMTPFFWSVAADSIASSVEKVLLASSGEKSDSDIVIGITGGPSASEAIKQLANVGMDPAF